MRILLNSVFFHPSVGGIQTVSRLLAEKFQAAGHDVCLVTETPFPHSDRESFRVIRRPDWRTLTQEVKNADVVFHNNISLRAAWPLLLYRRPWVIAHHMWIPTRGSGAIQGTLKRAVLSRALNISVSRAVADSLPVTSHVIPNPYAHDVFRLDPSIPRSRDLIFVGRLIEDKGTALLIDALHRLHATGLKLNLTIVGTGTEETNLKALAIARGLASFVHFAGAVIGKNLARLLNGHRVIVVPSLWEEPFGIVALEGMACGCVPIVTRSGGLPEAVGDAGVIAPSRNAEGIAQAIATIYGASAANSDRLRQNAIVHLERHTGAHVANAYLEILSAAASDGGVGRSAAASLVASSGPKDATPGDSLQHDQYH